jgi:hypothetical protein
MTDPPQAKNRAGDLVATSPENCVAPDVTPLICSTQPGYSHQDCPHETRVLERMSEGHVHYGLERCGVCRRVLRWISKPETIEARKLRAAKIARLTMVEALNEWERRFIESVSKFRKHSPKQVAVIDRLAAEYLEKEGTRSD